MTDAPATAVRERPARIGLIVNPVAGIGGAVALKGSDGASVLAEARRRGGVSPAPRRTALALDALRRQCPDAHILAGGGPLGADAAREAGFTVDVVTEPADPSATTREDTCRTAAALLRRGPDLVLFAGGDGTARDIFDVVAADLAILGIPAGVKMHSSAFARTPGAAGEAAARFVSAPRSGPDPGAGAARAGGAAGPVPSREGMRRAARGFDAEIMDIDEDALREGRVSARLYGYARVPDLKAYVQSAKAGPALHDDTALAGACAEIGRALDPDRLTLFGPGTTTRRVMQAAGLDGTLLGVDAVLGGRVIGADLTERQILDLLDRTPGGATIVVGVIGGQGFLFGRGNQQLGPSVLARVGRENIVVVAAMEKLAALGGAGLSVDTGDPATDAMLAGYIRVHTAPRMTSIARIAVAAPAQPDAHSSPTGAHP